MPAFFIRLTQAHAEFGPCLNRFVKGDPRTVLIVELADDEPKEHYDVSQAVGEEVLLPAVRVVGPETIIAAVGTSCRHQIVEGTGRQALHPIQILA